MKAPPMNAKQRRFFRLYFGKDDRLAGNATRCYKAAYGLQDDRSAQVSASRLLKKPQFAEWLAALEAEAMAEININADFVKSHAVRILQRAMGDEPITSTVIETDEAGQEVVRHSERYEADPGTALKALQLVGQHKDVQAFTQTVEHTHTHLLEQRLAARSKAIESSAQVIEGSATQVVDNAGAAALPNNAPIDAGEAIPVVSAADAEKRVHQSGGQEDRAVDSDQIASEREGATAD